MDLHHFEPIPELAASGLDQTRPFTLAQARGLGLERSLLRRLHGEGLLRRWFRAVYVHHMVESDPVNRAQALSLVVPPRSVVVDRSAAWLLGVDATFPWEQGQEFLVEVFRTQEGARLRRPGCAGGERRLASRDVMITGQVRHTTPLRTALDLGRLLPRERALAAMDALARLGGFGAPALRQQLPRFRGYRGVVQLRALASMVDPLAESPAESRLRLSWLDSGLPTPSLQHQVADGRRVAFLDIADPRSRFAAEYDGQAWHSSARDRAHDRSRREWLTSLGWHIEVFTKADYRGEAVLPEVRLRTAYRHSAR